MSDPLDHLIPSLRDHAKQEEAVATPEEVAHAMGEVVKTGDVKNLIAIFESKDHDMSMVMSGDHRHTEVVGQLIFAAVMYLFNQFAFEDVEGGESE